MTASGKIFIFSAPSGSGKTTIVHRILKTRKSFGFSVSATTRQRRENEAHGKDYFFLNEKEFKKGIEEKRFLEWEEVYPGRYYGTLISEVENMRGGGHSVVFDVDVKGGLNIKKFYGEDACAFFIQPPSIAVLKQRLTDRATDSAEDIEKRVAKATRELEYADSFDHIIVNDDLELAVTQTEKIISDFLNKS